MSWAEVIKINSAFRQEPLNYMNYMNDIATFGAESYIFTEENIELFKDLMCNSMAVYGHKAIREYLLLNTMVHKKTWEIAIKKHKFIGQMLNLMFKTHFAKGNYKNVTKNMKGDDFNKLPSMIQECFMKINSEIELKDIANIFDVEEKTDILDYWLDDNEAIQLFIVNNNKLWKINNWNVDLVIKISKKAKNSIPAIKALLQAALQNNLINELFNNDEFLNMLILSEEMLKFICYEPNIFAAIIN